MHTTHDAPITRAARLHKIFNWLVIAAIIASTYLAAYSLLGEDNPAMEVADEGILWFFLAEVGVRLLTRIKKAGWWFWRDAWLMFDIAVMLLALLPLGDDVLALRIMRAARLAHISRHLPHLRHTAVLRWIPLIGRK
jgi:hypothetical protein